MSSALPASQADEPGRVRRSGVRGCSGRGDQGELSPLGWSPEVALAYTVEQKVGFISFSSFYYYFFPFLFSSIGRQTFLLPPFSCKRSLRFERSLSEWRGKEVY